MLPSAPQKSAAELSKSETGDEDEASLTTSRRCRGEDRLDCGEKDKLLIAANHGKRKENIQNKHTQK